MPALWALTDYFPSRNFSVTVLILLFYSKMVKQINLSRVVHDDFCDDGALFALRRGPKSFSCYKLMREGEQLPPET